MVFKDYYKILGVSFSASPEEIKRMYRKLALRYHPDTTAGDKAAEIKFREVKEAYEILSKPIQRESFDYDYKKYYQTGSTNNTRRPQTARPQHGSAAQPKTATRTSTKNESSSLTAAAYLARTKKIFYTYSQTGVVVDEPKLYRDLSNLLQQNNIKQLLQWGDVKTNKAIVQQALTIIDLLSYKYVDALGLRLAQLAGTDNETITAVFKYCKQRKQKINLQRAILIGAMIAVFILFILLVL